MMPKSVTRISAIIMSLLMILSVAFIPDIIYASATTAVENIGFEAGTLSGYNQGPLGASITSDSQYVASGTYAAKITVPSGQGADTLVLGKNVSVVKDKEYIFYMSLKATGAEITSSTLIAGLRLAYGSKRIQPTEILRNGTAVNSDITNDWQRIRVTDNNYNVFAVKFTAPETTTVSANIISYKSGIDLYVDDMNLVTVDPENKGFENGSMSGYNVGTLGATIVTDSQHVANGTYAAKITVPSGQGVDTRLLYKNYSIEKDRTYTFFVSLKAVGSTISSSTLIAGLRIMYGNVKIQPTEILRNGTAVNSDITNDWQRLRVTDNNYNVFAVKFTAPETTTVSVNLISYKAGIDLYVDDMNLVTVDPENRGFENGNLSNYNMGPLSASVTSDSQHVASGTYAAKITVPSGQGADTLVLGNNVSVEKDKEYVFYMSLKAVGSEITSSTLITGLRLAYGSKRIQPTEILRNGTAVNSDITNDWQRIRVTDNNYNVFAVKFTAPETTTVSANIISYKSGITLYVDDISYECVTPPTPVDNTGFEAGTTDGYNIGTLGATIVNNSKYVASGTYAAKVTVPSGQTPDTRLIYKDYSVVKDKKYTFYISLKADGATINSTTLLAGLRLMHGSTKITPIEILKNNTAVGAGDITNDWQRLRVTDNNYNVFAITFIAPDTTTVTANLISYMSGIDLYVDDMRLTEVVAPVDNTGFENGDITGYTVGANLSVNVQSEIKDKGNYSAFVSWNGAGTQMSANAISKQFDVEAGKDYIVTYRIKVRNPVGNNGVNAGLFVRLGGNNIPQIEGRSDGSFSVMSNGEWWTIRTSDTEWHTYSMILNSGTHTSLKTTYFQYNQNASAYIDDITVQLYTRPVEVDNTGFETGDLTGYTVGGTLSASVQSEIKDKGNYAAYVSWDGTGSQMSDNAISKTFSVDKNTYYTITYRIKLQNPKANNGASSGLFVRLKDKSNPSTQIYSDGAFTAMSNGEWWTIRTGDAEWHSYTMIVNTSENDSLTTYYFQYSKDVSAYIDDITCQKSDMSMVAEADKILNPSFEREDTFPYNTTGNVEISLTDDAQNGAQGLKVVGEGTVGQTVAVSPNTYYEWTVYLKFTAGKRDWNTVNGYLGIITASTGIASTIEGKGGFPGSKGTSNYNPLCWYTDGYTKYVVKFYTFDNTSVTLTYMSLKETAAVLDNMSLVKKESADYITSSDENVVFFNDFEDVHSGAFGIGTGKADDASINSSTAYSGNRSVAINAINLVGVKNAYYETTNTVLTLKQNTTYRISCYAKVNFESDGDDAILRYDLGDGYQVKKYPLNSEWQKIEYLFSTGQNTKFGGVYVYPAFNIEAGRVLYIDDFCLEEVQAEIIDYKPEKTYCETLVNRIDNGSFENAFKGSIWENIAGFTRVENKGAETGSAYVVVSGDVTFTKDISVRPGRAYTFAYSYNALKDTNLEIGILIDGKVISVKGAPDSSSLSVLKSTNGKWVRNGFTFITSSTGMVTLVINGNNVNCSLDEISLFESDSGVGSDINDYNAYSDDLSVITTDFDVVVEEIIEGTVSDIEDAPTEEEEEEKTYLKKVVRKKKKNNNGDIIMWTVIISVIVLVIAAVVILLLIRKKKNRKVVG